MVSGELQLLALTQAHTETALAMGWAETIVIVISILGCGLWLHIELKKNRDEIRQIRSDLRREMQQRRSDVKMK